MNPSQKSEFYGLVAELCALGMHGRLIARVLGASSSYVAVTLKDLGLGRRYADTGVDDVVARLPANLKQRVAAFRAARVRAPQCGTQPVVMPMERMA